MHNDSDESAPLQSGPVSPSVESVARRRMLLKSLGKGGAVVAAASPLSTFAAPGLIPTLAGTQCSVSGFNSVLGSRAPASSVPCGGWRPRHYFDPNTNAPLNWPNLTNPDPLLPFNALFPASSVSASLISILVNTPESDEAYVIAAYLYAAHLQEGHGVTVAYPAGSVAWPYATRISIQAHFNEPTVRNDAIAFYRNILTTP